MRICKLCGRARWTLGLGGSDNVSLNGGGGIYPSTSYMDAEFRVACLQGKKMPAIISLIYLMFSLLVFTKR